MEQRDYILREIEKIGAILRAIKQKLFGGNINLAIVIEIQTENVKEILLTQANFDLDKFMNLNIKDSNEYITNFNGFNIENIELLAECITQIGFNEKCVDSKKYLEKALQLYDLCNLKSGTYSIEREANVKAINFITLK